MLHVTSTIMAEEIDFACRHIQGTDCSCLLLLNAALGHAARFKRVQPELQGTERLASREQVAQLIAEAQAAAVVKLPDAGKEFGRGKRCRYIYRLLCRSSALPCICYL